VEENKRKGEMKVKVNEVLNIQSFHDFYSQLF
jgi:hypothetical protein